MTTSTPPHTHPHSPDLWRPAPSLSPGCPAYCISSSASP